MAHNSETDDEEIKKIWLEKDYSLLVHVLYGILDHELEQIMERPKKVTKNPAKKEVEKQMKSTKASGTTKRQKTK